MLRGGEEGVGMSVGEPFVGEAIRGFVFDGVLTADGIDVDWDALELEVDVSLRRILGDRGDSKQEIESLSMIGLEVDDEFCPVFPKIVASAGHPSRVWVGRDAETVTIIDAHPIGVCNTDTYIVVIGNCGIILRYGRVVQYEDSALRSINMVWEFDMLPVVAAWVMVLFVSEQKG